MCHIAFVIGELRESALDAVAADDALHRRQADEARSHGGVPGTQGLFPNRQRPLVERFGLGELVLGILNTPRLVGALGLPKLRGMGTDRDERYPEANQ